MVDFSNEGTVSKPPRDIVALIILEKLYNYLEADEIFAKQKLGGAGSMTNISRSRLRNLFLICQPMLQRRLSHEEYNKLNELCTNLTKSVEPEELLECFFLVLAVLDKLELTKLDTKAVYNKTRVEESNKHHGYG